MNYDNVMLDLETLGTKAGSVILSIGAVFFHPVIGLGAPFSSVINRQSAEAAGLRVDERTMAWWRDRTPEAREILLKAENPAQSSSMLVVLSEFAQFLKTGGEDVKLWGNGSDFDNVLLASAYEALGMELPWKFYNNRCYRTLKNLTPMIPMRREGVHHNAYDDARSQALHAISILGRLQVHMPVGA